MMIDLKISYDNENGQRITAQYETIMDFIDTMNSDEIDIPMFDYENVDAIFFENNLLKKHFETIEELYEHCVRITG